MRLSLNFVITKIDDVFVYSKTNWTDIIARKSDDLETIIMNNRFDLIGYSHCTNDYIAVYTGPTTSSTLLKMMCGSEKSVVIHAGPTLLVEFKSGNEVPPYVYNGFLARVRFTEITTEAPTTVLPSTTGRFDGIDLDYPLTFFLHSFVIGPYFCAC